MCAKGRGNGKTPPRVVGLLAEAVAKSSQAAVARATGITRLNIQLYLKGTAEPTTTTLQKLAQYFDVNIEWLRGSMWARKAGGNLFDPLAYCAECGNELQASSEGFEANEEGEIVGDRRLRFWPCESCCKKG